jgi:hypothetical protein
VHTFGIKAPRGNYVSEEVKSRQNIIAFFEHL